MSRRSAAALLAAGILLAACGGPPADEPPAILYGEDVCDRCRMVISEVRHAAAARREGRDYRFDDPGCLVAWLGEWPEDVEHPAWVHDERESWRPVREAWFALDPELGTPMASGVLAFGGRQAAAAVAAEPLRWSELGARVERRR